MAVETIELGEGRRATYEVVGEGEPAIWFEGGPGFNAALGRGDCEVLAGRFRCHLVDPPGTGGTTPQREPRGYGLRGTAAFYEEVRVALGLGRATLLGHSWGGAVCLAYAALYPRSTRRCVAIDPWAASREVDDGPTAQREWEAVFARFAGEPWLPAARRALDAGISPDFFDCDDPEATWCPAWPLYFAHPERPLAQQHIARLTRDLRFGREPGRFGDEASYDDDLPALLPQISVPVLVIVGELDFICGPAQASQVASRVPGCRYVVIPDCGHIPAYEEPDEFRRIVFDWCDSH
jgi:pimeloyl-ACP methyl ester carboxylesterase